MTSLHQEDYDAIVFAPQFVELLVAGLSQVNLRNFSRLFSKFYDFLLKKALEIK